jgi:hypothetical protein
VENHGFSVESFPFGVIDVCNELGELVNVHGCKVVATIAGRAPFGTGHTVLLLPHEHGKIVVLELSNPLVAARKTADVLAVNGHKFFFSGVVAALPSTDTEYAVRVSAAPVANELFL